MKIKLLLLILLSPLIVACSALPFAQTSAGEEIVTIAQAGLSPQEVVENFLTAWASEDFAAMHSLLSPRSVAIYPLEAFQALYTETHTDIGFSGVNYTIDDVLEQGNSAAVTYDVVLNTATFGDIPDELRTMRLVREGDEWQIAWSPMDVINGMTANVSLVQNRNFPPRGNIYDRNGLPLVSENGSTVNLILVLGDMFNVPDCTRLLSRVMLRPTTYFNQLYIDYQAQDSAFFVGEIDGEIYARYRTEITNLCGTDIDVPVIGTKVNPVFGRSYFGNGAAAHITGALGFNTNPEIWRERGYTDRDRVGSSGIEAEFQDVLAGTPQQSLQLIDSSGAILRDLGSAAGSPSAPVKLTIDRELQWQVAQAFSDAWNDAANNWARVATGGAAVVMDVNTGAVLAMYSFPTYDPRILYPESYYFQTATVYAGAQAQLQRAYANDNFLPLGPQISNRAFSEQYSPGSVFKIISALAAGDSGVWDGQKQFDCDLRWEGQRYGDTQAFREDWRLSDEWEPAGEITMSEALTTSCNPFFWEVGALMFQREPDLLFNYARQFGMGQRTGLVGIGTNEAGGNIPLPTAMDIALNDVIGQGDTQVTALQMARLVSAVANGGTLYRPYIVSQVGGLDGATVSQSFDPEAIGELGVSPEALAIVQQGMCAVPTNERLGTSYTVFDDNAYGAPAYTSCGKTGTAQAGPSPNAWYVAYAPADNPQIAVVVVVPSSRHGSEVSAPITRRILDYYFGGEGAIIPYPDWWRENEYQPVEPPQGV